MPLTSLNVLLHDFLISGITPRIKDSDDIGMTQFRGGFGFAKELFPRSRVVGIRRMVGNLECDQTIQNRIVGQIDAAESAPRQIALNLKAADREARAGSGSGSPTFRG